jgi:hypothetical protein
MATDTESDRSRAIGAGIGVGVGIGATWGIIMSTTMDGDPMTGLLWGAGAGLVIALISGAAVYRMATGG